MTTLIEALQGADMLEIDGLHAWQFELDDDLLQQPDADATQPLLWIECIDGRTTRRWQFSLSAVRAARHDASSDAWTLDDAHGTHQLKCFAAFRGDNLDDEDDDEAP
ncbi:DUF5629 family protein [Pseudomonas berkeleyensis]|uniref:DUF5629 family protein n=1 Tax=Pseudomonas berkeleyensis TaxID=2726956 RepID=A0A7G5DRM5_9PSED|nr:DUF5629 family protein [Pseudomonas berkeleyensis]QMV64400.1 DUF5629 family protein [Pseudomonas berkeleyensis]WSO39865.1 DUF5629 family protein [Pseudomonas berkeleyensis]